MNTVVSTRIVVISRLRLIYNKKKVQENRKQKQIFVHNNKMQNIKEYDLLQIMIVILKYNFIKCY